MLSRSGNAYCGVLMIRSKASSGAHGRPMCTSRVRPPDCSLIQRAAGSCSRPALITTSGHGGASGEDFPRSTPATRMLSERLEIALGTRRRRR